MGRRPLASAATACLALAVLLVVAAAVHGAGVPSSSLAASAGIGRAVVAATAFDAVRCKEQMKEKGGGAAACATLAGDDVDDKRVVPTGPNPLHNR
ncbi:unnamed protein product [Alopecurus aequalis]